MLVGAKVCDLTEDLLWFVCGLYVGILTSSLAHTASFFSFLYRCIYITLFIKCCFLVLPSVRSNTGTM